MKRIEVRPAKDGHDMRSNWETAWSGRVSSHTKKSAAKRKAREVANEGDTLVIKGTNGQILKSVTVRDASAGSDDESRGFQIHGMGTLDVGLTDQYGP